MQYSNQSNTFFSESLQMDLKAVSVAKGQYVYRDHLPPLCDSGQEASPIDRLQIGDQVTGVIVKISSRTEDIKKRYLPPA